ncbi:hypothetical protein HN018_09010 [Lichenicola cladoniae]|uniref:Pectate lyase superfamily protein domain-containing protein n=1 Tax=Lichenicola cladoniae TaxID=1484109 RepID=A0A6M8HPC4_9PROT|nr:hypothetical protein [Lichenicola cladoniae]NPD68332.1 hypothetical protein [Acetobacteraceae bacterium]QKE90166.1 hypothetical protein HN018_09010 [Lichenicola cladoniae]
MTSDGTDDAPSVNRAIAAACATQQAVHLSSRIYRLDSQILLADCHVNVTGAGWQEPAGGKIASGTVLHVTFLNKPVIQIIGNSSSGSIWSDIAAYEDQPVTASDWKPREYGYLFDVERIGGGITIQRIMCMNCTLGIRIHTAGRTIVRDFFGQFFDNEIYADKNFDGSVIDNARNWPWWSQSPQILSYQISHLDTFILGREDDLQAANLFTYAARSGLKLITTPGEGPCINNSCKVPGGSATMIHIGLAKFEACKWGIWSVTSPSYFDEGSIRLDFFSYQGQDPSVTTPAQIPAASAIKEDGWQTQISAGLLKADFIDKYLIDDTDGTAATNFVFDAAFVNFSHGQARVYYLNAPRYPSTVAIGIVPQVYAPSPVKSAPQPPESRGIVSWPSLTPR